MKDEKFKINSMIYFFFNRSSNHVFFNTLVIVNFKLNYHITLLKCLNFYNIKLKICMPY